MDAAAFILGAIEGQVRVLEQLVGAFTVGGRDRHADAGGDAHLVIAEVERGADRGNDARGERGGRHRLIGGDLHDRELVATQPCDRIAFPDAALEAIANGLQQSITGGVPQRIVDHLEAVEIEAQHGNALFRRGPSNARSKRSRSNRRLGSSVSTS